MAESERHVVRPRQSRHHERTAIATRLVGGLSGMKDTNLADFSLSEKRSGHPVRDHCHRQPAPEQLAGDGYPAERRTHLRHKKPPARRVLERFRQKPAAGIVGHAPYQDVTPGPPRLLCGWGGKSAAKFLREARGREKVIEAYEVGYERGGRYIKGRIAHREPAHLLYERAAAKT
jgi:hypothetical protein